MSMDILDKIRLKFEQKQSTFSGFSVGCCINRERLSVTNLSSENNFADISTECSSRHQGESGRSAKQSTLTEYTVLSDNNAHAAWQTDRKTKVACNLGSQTGNPCRKTSFIKCLRLISLESVKHFTVCIIGDFTSFLSALVSNACMLTVVVCRAELWVVYRYTGEMWG